MRRTIRLGVDDVMPTLLEATGVPPPPDLKLDGRSILPLLQGRATPEQCPAFGRECTPEQPLGAPMVSSEGACAAWFRYRPAGVGGR